MKTIYFFLTNILEKFIKVFNFLVVLYDKSTVLGPSKSINIILVNYSENFDQVGSFIFRRNYTFVD